ncbi:hypothetical protein P280DRAFT_483530 [Massarina eburnea CBS 473.64]|uniref:Uncharacterized protein n=1 Tax=Massarina eburnea CBS 473.64 TaxID=1395130 RepID=A0A6A6RN25_9PLEO|nr:hypothetical protein P280DRAFT_483530 [Massarina eburnea CBS 473.64]
MGKSNTGTKHHCGGRNRWIGDISPGGCRQVYTDNLIYCAKHEMPCRNGCEEWIHLKNQDGCQACKGNALAQAKADRIAKEKAQVDPKQAEYDAFMHPKPEKKKRRD